VYAIPNFSALNVISQVAHGNTISGPLIFWNTAYAIVYTIAVLGAAILIFERRNLK
jgi:ABC-type transport system involved in multi-copper enzyme maturation permease subunit